MIYVRLIQILFHRNWNCYNERNHTAIDHFITDVDPLLQTIINAEKKECYIMGTLT